MTKEVVINSRNRQEFINVDQTIRDCIEESGLAEGLLTVFVPHTTAAVTINENADPAVVKDILYTLGKLVPSNDSYQHSEGNSDAHIKASLFGHSETLMVTGGKPLLGRWQSVFFCEFDGPRTRRMIIRIT